MRSAGKTKSDAEWLKNLGNHIHQLILEAGHKSSYDFVNQIAGDDISKSGLNFIINGESDPKATTLKALAKHLGVKPSELFNF
jgi:transcriptional regulator with XRE-family HTH domain